VAAGDELEEQVCGFGLEGNVADFVDDEERVAAEPDKFLLEASGVVDLGELRIGSRDRHVPAPE